MNEINVGVSTYYLISDLLVTLLKPGDEVVLFEPCYPCYYDNIEYAGGRVKAG